MAKVLVVEDDPDILGLVRHHLGKAKHQVLTADSAEDALEFLDQKDPPDVAVLDVSLPGIDGRELAKRLRQTPKTTNVRVVFLTASVDPDQIAAAKELADAYLTKPFVASALLATIDRLSQSSSEPEGW
jgi:CheY-like chemotaxis protein